MGDKVSVEQVPVYTKQIYLHGYNHFMGGNSTVEVIVIILAVQTIIFRCGLPGVLFNLEEG